MASDQACSTVDMIFVIRQVQQKCIEQNKTLYFVLTDLNREAFWTVLERFGYPKKFVRSDSVAL